MGAYIFHVDANSAFLSWSAAYRVSVLGEKTDLRLIPSIVGGDQEKRHGIMLAKSTPAKKYDIKTGEAIITAKQKCPGLVVIPPDYGLYVSASRAFIGKLRQYTDKVIQYSIDEAWAVFDGCEKLWDGKIPIRQIGVHTSKVESDAGRQYNLFDMQKYDRLETLNRTVDRIREKYGEDAVFRAGFLKSNVTHMSGGLIS